MQYNLANFIIEQISLLNRNDSMLAHRKCSFNATTTKYHMKMRVVVFSLNLTIFNLIENFFIHSKVFHKTKQMNKIKRKTESLKFVAIDFRIALWRSSSHHMKIFDFKSLICNSIQLKTRS